MFIPVVLEKEAVSLLITFPVGGISYFSYVCLLAQSKIFVYKNMKWNMERVYKQYFVHYCNIGCDLLTYIKTIVLIPGPS